METTSTPTSESNTDDCVICLSKITERAIATPCNHASFDVLCLISWLQVRSTCPLCKAEVATVQYDFRSEHDVKTFHVRQTHPPPRDPVSHTTTYARHARFHGQRRSPRAEPRPRPDIALLRRRFVYRENLYSAYVGANSTSLYRNWTPQLMASSSELQSRARTFIRRELTVFSFLYNAPGSSPTTSISNAEWLLTYILSILRTVDIKASDGHAEDLVSEFLGRETARLFLHELNAWLRSPYAKLEEWDREVQYRVRLPDAFAEDGRPVWNEREGKRRSRSPELEGECE